MTESRNNRTGNTADPVFRMRIYDTHGVNIQTSTEIFTRLVYPVHTRYGAELVGRWLSDQNELVVIWKYPNRTAMKSILASISEDPELIKSEQERRSAGTRGNPYTECLMRTEF